jgi:tyrosyl-tRNA synthetase
MNVFDELNARGVVAQTTHEDKIIDLLTNSNVTFYIGFDATADSLHVGHFLQMMSMSRMQRAGHRPVVLLGGGTTMVGDPSGRSDMRKIMTKETIAHNIQCFEKQMSKFLDFSPGKAMMVNNADWLLDLNYIEFLREIGVHFSVNRMLTFDCFKSRLEKGLSFLEFNYMLMQGYDFYRLFIDHNCTMQFGGDDQWANIIAGIELIKKKADADAFGMTFNLLTTSEGKKMGKTAKGAVWLDPEKTPPYEFFQYWRNIDDADVIKTFKMITYLELDEIDELSKYKGSEINSVKETLAYELTSLIHGEAEAQKALDTTRALFSDSGDIEHMPTTALKTSDLTDGKINILDLLVAAKLAPSKGEARRLVTQGGIAVNDKKVESIADEYSSKELSSTFIVKKGKKIFHRITLS